MSYTVRAERDGTGWWVITVPDVPGAISQCEQVDEIRANAAEVIGIQTGEQVNPLTLCVLLC